jgi:hypothetical protein
MAPWPSLSRYSSLRRSLLGRSGGLSVCRSAVGAAAARRAFFMPASLLVFFRP